jgi:RNA polymerase sigma factor (TIGR02999 family)
LGSNRDARSVACALSPNHDAERENPTRRRCSVKPASTNPDLLSALREPGAESIDRLVALTYEELRIIARRHLARGRRMGARSGTLGTTALVNEAYLKLVDQSIARPRDRAHFLAIATVAMRHVLIDRARARSAGKRGGGNAAATLDGDAVAAADDSQLLLEINEALDRVALIDARLAQVVECRFFGGLSEEEIAEVLGVTVRTVQRDWARARMLLRRELSA